MGKDDFKEFLLEEYKAFNDSMHKSEESGEKRLAFFYTLSSAAVGIISFLLPKTFTLETLTGDINNENHPKLTVVHLIIIVFLLSLFIIGIIIQRRLVKRNRTTDELKTYIAEIRKIFKSDFSDGLLSAASYNPFPQKPKKRKFSSLSDISKIMNVLVFAVIAILITFFLSTNLVYSEVAGAVAFIGAAIVFFWKVLIKQTNRKSHPTR